MSYINADTKIPRKLSIRDENDVEKLGITEAAVGPLDIVGLIGGSSVLVSVRGGHAATASGAAGGSTVIAAGAGDGAGVNGSVLLQATLSPSPFYVNTAGALPSLPLGGLIVVETAGNYTPGTAVVALYKVLNTSVGNAVFTGITGVTSVTLTPNEALEIWSDGADWFLLSTTGTIA